MPSIERAWRASSNSLAEDLAPTPSLPTPPGDRDSGLRFRAVEVVERAAVDGPDPQQRVAERRLFEALQAGNLAAALLLASTITYVDPDNDVARRIKLRCVERLRGRETRELPSPVAVPRRLVGWSALEGHSLSKEATYLFSLVDGLSTVEALVDASAIPPLAAYDALGCLLRLNVVGTR